MKYIFDFDDVLFYNTDKFKKHMFSMLSRAGVPEDEAREYYALPEIRGKEFSLKNFIKNLFLRYDIEVDQGTVYEEIMKECPKFLNFLLLEKIKDLGAGNCYIVTFGEKEFNEDKIKYSGIDNYFLPKNIHIVPESKRKAIQEICEENPDSPIEFWDNRQDFLDEVKDIPNIKTVLYDKKAELDFANRELKVKGWIR